MTRGLAGFFRDNLEAFAVAIAMALVIRHYCIEAFRIPTRSMTPTLLGDDGLRGRHGDRILVDKFVPLRRDPRRYEVWVFQYPLNRNRNFIKRVAGLSGEWLRIVDGDLWSSTDEGATWTIQRKPPGAREQLLFPYYPRPAESPDSFRGRKNWDFTPGWRISEREGIFKLDASRGTERLRFEPNVTPFGIVDVGGPPYAGDVRVRFDLAVERPGSLVVQLTEHGAKHRLVLGTEESYAVVVRDGKEHRFDVDARLEAGDELSVQFANIDDMLVVVLDGDHDVELEIPFPNPPSQPHDPKLFGEGVQWKHEIAIESEGLVATLSDLHIDRDLYYNADDPDPLQVWKIPEGHFFMLGDNTRASKDSRVWIVDKVHLQNGEVIAWEPPGASDVAGQPHAPTPGENVDVHVPADVDGLVRDFRGTDMLRVEQGVRYPFVSRDHLIGRAFAIFWPIHLGPVYRGPSRVNLIR